ncbi:HAD-IIIC family phosphatase [Leptospira fluminis]|uniref:HAD-IIIC family phosphatase n=1 Tax=Leptospira fluminis TaxID=2484979 RepID=A0A4R9GM38_9LEPT|nr:HAD-IIIC family phosphatase [Leptospira fluminis]TGK17272.1 HAD-IIIC family phosphatase [Leptospira fluminis]
MQHPKYSELLKINQQNFKPNEQVYESVVISNVVMGQFKDILEYHLRKNDINAVVQVGEYDNILQDAVKYAKLDCIFIFYEIANLLDQYLFSDPETLLPYDVLKGKIKGELSFLFENLRGSKLVFLNLFSTLPYTSHTLSPVFPGGLIEELNLFLRENAPPSFQLVGQDNIYAKIGLQEAFDLRFFLSSKAPFKNEYFHSYAELALPAISGSVGKIKKVLVLDCDNTLWKGIVGEDGIDGIKVYREIQSIIFRQIKKGVLVAIVSKNNPEDVRQVFEKHPDMILKTEHVVTWKVNWKDKATNILELAQELNLGTDSFVFVDDNEFEIQLVQSSVPGVTSIMAAKNYTDYVQSMLVLDSIFYKKNISKEDLDKASQYRTESLRQEAKGNFVDLADYLKSLELKIVSQEDAVPQINRIAQLTQKTNQFNLTTKRYTESEISNMMESPKWKVFSYQVTDRYGDYGLTCVSLIELKEKQGYIDSFLLSCRILGRNLEKKILEDIVLRLKDIGIDRIDARFIRTEKNSQTEDFYDQFNFVCQTAGNDSKDYSLLVENFPNLNLDYIEVVHA